MQFRVLAVRFCLLHRSFLSGIINGKINGTSKCVYLPISKQNSISVVRNLLVHNTICYYVQVNSLRLKSSVSSKWQVNSIRGTIYFAVDGTSHRSLK